MIKTSPERLYHCRVLILRLLHAQCSAYSSHIGLSRQQTRESSVSDCWPSNNVSRQAANAYLDNDGSYRPRVENRLVDLKDCRKKTKVRVPTASSALLIFSSTFLIVSWHGPSRLIP